ncbi:hypothetical protein PENSUB_4266 [Penicillium subrubescens]|uniref:HTH CENPB-type domain-containing protein n=1 Tax=Penicillium subrubescens TaxID=1316194 RepID=A0A1Q5UCX5_9EURO|nr:hypothetical protein PENSUB_4266 [Penicillium subrubescens]
MPKSKESNASIESRIQLAILELENVESPNIRAWERAKNLPYQRLLARFPPKRLAIAAAANTILASTHTGLTEPPTIGDHWLHRFLQRHPEYLSRRQRAIDIERKKCLGRQIAREWFNSYQETTAQYGITADDIWNFDETGFNIGVGQDQWIITREPKRQIFGGFSTNREYATAIEAVSATGSTIAPVVILSAKVLLLRWFEIVGDERIAVTDTGYLNNVLALQISIDWPEPTIVLENLVDEVDEVDFGFNTPSPPSTIAAGSQDSSDLSTPKTADRVKKLEKRLEDKISRIQQTPSRRLLKKLANATTKLVYLVDELQGNIKNSNYLREIRYARENRSRKASKLTGIVHSSQVERIKRIIQSGDDLKAFMKLRPYFKREVLPELKRVCKKKGYFIKK